MKMKFFLATVLVAFSTAVTGASIVNVNVVGEVDFGGVNNGQWQNAGPGDPVVMSFQVDSNNFVDSTNFPVRGYEIINPSFSLSIDGLAAGMANPYPAGLTPYFVLRDNDPAVDGFFLGTNIDGFPDGVATDEPALLAPTFDAIFEATYEGTRLSSLDILDAVGIYDFTGLSVFNWGLEDGPAQPMGFIFDSWRISVAVPEPSTLISVSIFGMIIGIRRRR